MKITLPPLRGGLGPILFLLLLSLSSLLTVPRARLVFWLTLVRWTRDSSKHGCHSVLVQPGDMLMLMNF